MWVLLSEEKRMDPNHVCYYSSAPVKPQHHSYSHLTLKYLFVWEAQTVRADLEHLLHTLPFTIIGYDKTH